MDLSKFQQWRKRKAEELRSIKDKTERKWRAQLLVNMCYDKLESTDIIHQSYYWVWHHAGLKGD